MRACVMIGAVLLASCASSGLAAAPKKASPRTAADPNQAVFAEARRTIADKLKDPLSAQFGSVRNRVDWGISGN